MGCVIIMAFSVYFYGAPEGTFSSRLFIRIEIEQEIGTKIKTTEISFI